MLRNLVHVVLAVLLWVVFVGYWWIVFRRPINPDTAAAIATLAALSFFAILYLYGWMVYNIRLAKRLPKRVRRRRGMRGPIQDFLGRWIVVDHPTRVMKANYIEVEVRKNVVNDRNLEEKIFRTTRTLG